MDEQNINRDNSEQFINNPVEAKNKHDVFISYSTKNKNVADAIVADFEQNGIKCWYAPRDILPGQEWVSAIKEGLTEAKVFVLVYTSESNDSRQVMNEVALAFNAGKTIIPFRLTEGEMSNELEYYLTRVHWLDALTKPLSKNIEKLRHYVEVILEHTQNTEAEIPKQEKPSGSSLKRFLNRKFIIPTAAALVLIISLITIFVINKGNYNYMTDGISAYNSQYHTEQDNRTARESFENAKEKNADAYYYLGKLDERDYDFESAKENYETGIRMGSNLARLGLGNLYYSGNGVAADLEKARELFQEALDNGCIEANLYMGLLYANGLIKGQEADAKKALECFSLVDKSKYADYRADARNMTGQLYMTGYSGVERNYEEAKKCFEETARLYPYYEGDANDALAKLYIAIGDDVFAEDCYRKELEFYEKAASMGNIKAMNQTGLLYRQGKGCEADGEKALDYYKDAADLGSYEAMSNIGLLYRYGLKPIQEDIDSAYRWYKKAADAGQASAMNDIGDMYREGVYPTNTDMDEKERYNTARQWYEKAVSYGYGSAYYKLGNMYKEGLIGDEQDYDKALEYYEKGADMGSSAAMNQLGFYYSDEAKEPDNEKANYWYQRAANLGNDVAMYNLGVNYENGLGVEKNYETAAVYYRMAGDEGNIDALVSLAQLYAEGNLSEDGKPDYENCLKYLSIAADTGSAASLNNIGVIYKNGYGLEKADYDTALEYFIKAGDEGANQGYYNAGNTYYELKDYENARLFYEDKGSYEEYGQAAYRLGLLYYDDTVDNGVVDNDSAKAKKFFLKALELGYDYDKATMLENLGWIYYGENDDKNAADYFSQSADLSEDALLTKNAGACYFKGGDYDKAVIMYSYALMRGYNGDADLRQEMKNMIDSKKVSDEVIRNYAAKWIQS
ncbi:MAG: TIR domain-containing protein [Butyrivibrio sp.]|nr:TIR domain-containing protein [Butyrivibrio sp.]